MPHMLVYDQSKQEIGQIRDWICAVYTGKEELFFHSASNFQDLLLQLSGLNEVSFCCADFEADGERAVCAIRECDNEALIVIIASPSTPPQTYIQLYFRTGEICKNMHPICTGCMFWYPRRKRR